MIFLTKLQIFMYFSLYKRQNLYFIKNIIKNREK